ncbi:uncharacterized protein LOC117812458 [Notolabrus celidotus]|uniref:uncharacterized protein LOC117812458 n=1 Tax=Notolabrus celidotus TaxID=1203425 RepID=UPI0014900516|nr:uncharacterized protein LOC117812458 [Notolabrus celidotus]
MIITALAAASAAQGPNKCKFPESTAAAAQQCSGAEGRLLIFQLTDKADSNLRLKKDDKYVITRIKKLKIEFQHKEYASDAKVFPNGSFILGRATKNHSGDYMLEEHTSGGVLIRTVNLHLEIQAPVSKPAVSQVCSSAEQRSISCSSEGEEVEFIFTLDGEILKHTRDQSQSLNRKAANMQGTKTKQDQDIATIGLPGQLTGNLTCSVWNNVSLEETVIHLNICKAKTSGEETSGATTFVMFSSFPVVAVAVTASFLAIVLVALGCGLTILLKTPASPPANEAVTENPEEEIIYSDVIVIQRTRTTEPGSDPDSTEPPPETVSVTSLTVSSFSSPALEEII